MLAVQLCCAPQVCVRSFSYDTSLIERACHTILCNKTQREMLKREKQLSLS